MGKPAIAARAYVLSQYSEVTEPAATSSSKTPPDYFEGVGTKAYLSAREPPELLRLRDGTYRFAATAFDAFVAKDGSVSFKDRYEQGTTLSFDITDHMMRKRGEDPYRVEKQWFLNRTADFRMTLFKHWERKQLSDALTKLRQRLHHIASDGTLSVEQKEERITRLYLDTSDDQAGSAARETLEGFVATHMPGLRLERPSE
ncbi:MAG: hypothetical protein AAF500_14935 [Myxococcota bacterium]